MILEIFFWILVCIVVYTYLGYTVLLWLINLFFKRRLHEKSSYQPEVTLLIAAYNEKKLIAKKTQNGFAQTYPQEKITQLWVTDGSDDGSHELLQSIDNVKVIHVDERGGKTAALNRAISYVKTPITIFTDANTLLNPTAVEAIVDSFADPLTGCVAGEKRVRVLDNDDAVSSGEGFYWKYESLIKRLESNTGSVLAAAGELFALRTHLYEPLPSNIILDDFVLSSWVALKGYRVKYCPEAWAEETPSTNILEEKKRKIRIAAGAFQTMHLFPRLFNVFKNPIFFFKFISHKVFRWVVVPPSFIILPLLSAVLLFLNPNNALYLSFFVLSGIFYTLVFVGKLLRNRKMRFKSLFLPYYIFTMNMAIMKGFFRYCKGNQDVKWEKAMRIS